MSKRTNRLLSLLMAVVMVVTLAVPAMAAEEKTNSFEKVDNSILNAKLTALHEAEKYTQEAPYGPNDTVRVSIVLEKDSTIEAGYAPMGIADNEAAMRYRKALKAEQEVLIQTIETALGEDLDVVWNLTLAANLISANIQYGQIEAIEAIPGVAEVVLETQYSPDVVSKTETVDPNMATSGTQIGSTAAWAAGYTGAGSKIAIIDTGLDTLHEAFNSGAFDYSLSQLDGSYDLMDASDIQKVVSELNVQSRRTTTANELYINSKVPFGFNYIDKNLDVSHSANMGEHGSHVAGISAANAYVMRENSYVPSLTETFVQGVAPDAQLLVMKVFGTNGGAYDSDYMASIEDAVLLGADSVNLSLGSAAPGMTTNAYYQYVMDNLIGSGVVVVMSAGNSGHWYDAPLNGVGYLYLDDVSTHTGGSPGTYTNSLGVASVNNDGGLGYYITVGDKNYGYIDGDGSYNQYMYTMRGDYEYVFIDGTGTPEDWAAVGSALRGRIAVCARGDISFSEKATNAVAAGAVATIIYNNVPGMITASIPDYQDSEPVVTVSQIAGAALKENATKTGSYYVGTLTLDGQYGATAYYSGNYTISSFSSWGVPGSLTMKPEISAPGGNIYSVGGYVPGYITDHDTYENMSGTSMAAPQVSGMVAVLTQYIRESGLEAQTGKDARVLAHSLLMSTAVPMIDGTSNYYYPILQQGAGQANIGNAVAADSYILMNADANASYADGKVKAELGDDPDRTGKYTFSFTINNLESAPKTFTVDADVFTQGAFSSEGVNYMERTTAEMEANVSWKVNGQPLQAGVSKDEMDFNGDGYVNENDGQAILEFVVGNIASLANQSKADLNGDGEITSYDAYLFFTFSESDGITVPANGSVTVEVTIALTDAEKQFLDTYYVNGAYVQAFVYAESITDEEGVVGTSHSIPVLGYYGSWTDPSMYDKGSFMEYLYGEETRYPYIANNLNSNRANGLLAEYAYDPGTIYYLGGNPVIQDETYMPERNAINNINGDRIYGAGFTMIRNAAEVHSIVRNASTGEYINSLFLGSGVYGAYYHVNGGSWQQTYYQLEDIYDISGIAENTALEVGLVAFPEYYANDPENFDLSVLGDGAFFTMPVVIDNTAPEMKNWYLSDDEYTLTITAGDNQHIAGVYLWDSTGSEVLAQTGSIADASAGQTLNFNLDVSEVAGTKFVVQIFDYAGNSSAYTFEAEIGELVDYVTGVTMSQPSATVAPGNTLTLVATVSPANASDRSVSWFSSDRSVATVSSSGVVTGVAEGTATITATSNLDSRYSASCVVTVGATGAVITGMLTDENSNGVFFELTLDGENYVTYGAEIEGAFITSATVDGTGEYAYFVNIEDGYPIYKARISDGTLLDYGDGPAGLPMWDLAYSPYFGSNSNPLVHGIYGAFLLPAKDPMAMGTSGFNLANTLSSKTGASFFLALTSLGYEQVNYDGTYYDTEHIVLLDNEGYIWNWWMYEADGGYSAIYGVSATDIMDWYPYFGRLNDGVEYHSFCSLVAADDGTLFLAAYYDDNCELYRLDVDGNSYVADYLGTFGDMVYPVALLDVEGVGNGAGANSVTVPADAMVAHTEELSAEMMRAAVEQAVSELSTINKTEKTPIAKGSLNAILVEDDTMQPQADGDTFIVDITAKDSDGVEIDSTNGMITVMYDPEQLTLTQVEVPANYGAINDNGSGMVTFAYVGPENLPAGEIAARLTFTNHSTEDTIVGVLHNDYNDAASGYIEYATVEASAPLVEWVSASTTLGGNIGLNFYVKLADQLVNDESTFVRFTFAGKTIDVPFADALVSVKDGVTRYRFTCALNARNMTDEVTAQVMTSAGAVGDPLKMSIAKYCNYMIQYGGNQELADLMKAMLNYGAAAQVLFDYNTDKLANAELSEEDKVLADVDASAYASVITGSEEGIKISSATLMLQTETSVRIYFMLTGDKTIDDYTFYVDGKEVTPIEKDGKYYVAITDIKAQDLDKTYTITVGGLSIQYSGLSYINTVIKNPATAGEALVNTAKAIFAYNKTAEEYFN